MRVALTKQKQETINMKLVERTYRIDAPDVNDLAIDVKVSIGGQAHVTTFTSAYLFVQWVFGFNNASTWYEFLIKEDIRTSPYAKVTCSINWCESGGLSRTLGSTIVNASLKEPQKVNSPYFEEHWETAWEDAVASAKAQIALGYLKNVKLVEDDK